MPYFKQNPLTQLAPKTPSVLIRTSRYAALLFGVVYGSWRLRYLTKKEAASWPEEKKIRDFIAAKKQHIYLTKSEEEINGVKAEIGD